MASQTLPKTLENIQYFLHGRYVRNRLDEIHVVTIGEEVPVCLKAYNFSITGYTNYRNEELRMIQETTTEVEDFSPILKWKMTVQKSRKDYKTYEEVMEILKDARAVFGVWGEKQRFFFASFLKNVVDIAPLVMESVVKFDQETDQVIKPYEKCLLLPYLTIGELFLYVLRMHAPDYENLATNAASREEFENWIGQKAWEHFVDRA